MIRHRPIRDMDTLHLLFLTALAYSGAGAFFVLRFSDVLGMLSERVADDALTAQRQAPFYQADPEIYLVRKSQAYLATFVVASWLFYPIVACITRITSQRLLNHALQGGPDPLGPGQD